MAGGESKGLRRYDKENLLWQFTVAIRSLLPPAEVSALGVKRTLPPHGSKLACIK